ncbi:murein biosynthesis protein MurJ [Bacillus sp. AFS015802]|uniref:murein biosynthesis integral membrane protein MurJ n=1 Tax=Bacillus sp. AFS015802 TaxID=2033486 RepID=UPI000BF5A9AE|nr:lipid II flippase MurJ [Bacillus sp. AFS015802]PFA67465.1 murein biosynthesis protein MurJ [Bacillus sp. AFS015802]
MSNLKRTAIWITLLALILKLSGFLRESIIAKEFGANAYTDGYLIAFSFITLVVAMISIGFNNVFLPLYVKHKEDSPAETERNANGIMNSTVALFLIITIAGYFLVPYFVPFLFGDMKPATEKVAVDITKIFFLFMSAIALNGILESYLQGRRIFVPSQISKLLATLMGAVFALLFSDTWGIYSLAYGFVFGTILGIIVQFFFLTRNGFKWMPTFKVDETFKKAFIVLIIPSLLNSVVGQINMFVNKIFASGTVGGAVTYLNNASLLISIPNAIYATTIAAIIFTLLSEQVNDQRKFQNTFFMGMEISLLTLMPIAAGLWVVGEEALSFIYERGKFTAGDTANTYTALVLYLPLIVTQGLQFIVSKSLYAQGKTGIVFRISVTTIVVNLILNFLLVDRYGYPALAVASSVVSVYYLIVSSVVVYRGFEGQEARKLWRLFSRAIPPTVLMVLPIYFLKKIEVVSNLYSLFQLAILVPIGVIVYTVALRFFYKEGFYRLLNMVKKKKAV